MSGHEMKKTTVTQFLLALVGALIPVLIVAFLIFKLVMGIQTTHVDAVDTQAATEEITKRLKPVGEVAIGEAKPDAGGVVDGKKVYEGLCQACHATGAAGAPKAGDKGAWGPRISQGKDTLFKHAIGGFTGKSGAMPAKGGNPALSDDEVKAAVEHLIGLSK
ncbi:cytochrome c5 [Sulfuricella denitrificans skB26]|uniref:Cytochrome c5 n=1 Tax=Sulfuricella denitrificans (strain DSM 22764 / NBRC 105220 / skB26) TaxID=1163617 RepID=S6ANU6_SULDS|nr:c-type cytochrome [Sulfuricella denitrificans]BAN36569.1 cytochrome c5 [Sulfuricella denitrificans skB26]